MTVENRQHPRYAIELDCEITIDGRHVSGRTHDVSGGGFCMLVNEPLPVGSSCEIRLALVFSENQFSEQLHLTATIMWSTPIRGRHQIGFKFAPLDEQSLAYLTLFIQFLEGGDESDSEGSEEELA